MAGFSQYVYMIESILPYWQSDSEPSDPRYSMFNSGGVEVEVGEFLHSFVKMVKPNFILETGTHFGISSTYMAAGLEDDAEIVTLDMKYHDEARRLHEKCRIIYSSNITQIEINSLEYTPPKNIDVLFLDTEPDIRFDEFVRFFEYVTPGGFIFIHDLHYHLGHEGLTNNGMYDWPFGDFREKIGRYITNYEVSCVNFSTPRGLTMFQKYKSGNGYLDYLGWEKL